MIVLKWEIILGRFDKVAPNDNSAVGSTLTVSVETIIAYDTEKFFRLLFEPALMSLKQHIRLLQSVLF